ncbi:MAG: NAD(P)H-hydrate dehydratase [Candidatus Nanohaloarchaea archaeon]
MVDDILAALSDRARTAVKGDHGHVLVVGGSHRYTNTPAIVALGALRTGIDLVTVAAPERSARVVPTFALNIVSKPLPGDHLGTGHVDTVTDLAETVDVIAIGPGLGRTEGTAAAVRDILASGIPAVIDADAIPAVASHPGRCEGNILTPHAGEFETLTGVHPGDDTGDREDAVTAAAAERDCTVLLKGPTDVISDGDRTATVTAGTPAMTRGGTGDVLTGIAAAVLARTGDPFDSARAAASLNGTAGEEAQTVHGDGFLIEEMIDSISQVL